MTDEQGTIFPLPVGWVQATDPKTGRVYYANPTTKETRWDPPMMAEYQAASGEGRPQHLSEDATDRTKNVTGNRLYSAASRNEYNRAYNDPGKLVAMTRVMLDKAAAFPGEAIDSDLELHSINPGQIADLCRLQRHQNRSKREGGQAYTPINPYTMLTISNTGEIEQARLDARLRSLRSKLEQFGGAQAKDDEK